MSESETTTPRGVRSKVTGEGLVTLAIEARNVGQPGVDDVVVRVEAAPINPTFCQPRTGLQAATVRSN